MDLNKQKPLKITKKKQVEVLKFSNLIKNQAPSTKAFISKRRLNPEIINTLESIKNKSKKLYLNKMLTKDIIKHMILQSSKQHDFLNTLLRTT